ncbi:MAG: tetratricopeptide repeat protein [Gemmataceae bacterium]
MRRVFCLAGLVLCLTGCAQQSQELVRAYNADGVHLYRNARYRDALDSFRAAQALKPDDPGLLYNLGSCYDQLGDDVHAEQFYRNCLQADANHADSRHALGVLLVRRGRVPEAQQMIQEWLVREPRLPAAYAEDGWMLYQAGDLPRARARLQQALELDANDERSLTELGRVYEAMNQPDRALVLYEKVLYRNPNEVDVRQRYNALLMKGTTYPKPN